MTLFSIFMHCIELICRIALILFEHGFLVFYFPALVSIFFSWRHLWLYFFHWLSYTETIRWEFMSCHRLVIYLVSNARKDHVISILFNRGELLFVDWLMSWIVLIYWQGLQWISGFLYSYPRFFGLIFIVYYNWRQKLLLLLIRILFIESVLIV